MCPKDRPKFSVIIKRLSTKDEEILHNDDREETYTSLGDVLTASFNLYKDLQLTYSSNNIVESTSYYS